MANAWDILFAATATLAATGPVKQRLACAYHDHLARLDFDDFPKEVRDDFATLVSTLSCVSPMRGESAVQATVRKMSDFEASACAIRVVNLLGAMTRLQYQLRQPMLRAVHSGAAD
jgi:hypothetical protein